MNLILLAAGKSSRIYNKIKKNKCLIKINNKSLIRNIIDNSSEANISEINIITGFKSQNIKNELKDYNKIKFTNNSKYKTTDMVYSSIIGLKKSKSDTIISYTDIVYTKKFFKIIKNSNKNFITIPYIKNWKSVWKKRNKNIFEDAETFNVDKNSNLREIGNKINDKNLKSVNGQFMGAMFIPKKYINIIIKKYNIYSNGKLQLTQFVNKLIKDNITIKCINYNDFWYEIDDYEDLINFKKL
jgi:choline kinase